MAKILYLGASDAGSTSRHRADALKRLGHQVEVSDPYIALENFLRGRLLSVFNFRTGYRFIQFKIRKWISSLINSSNIYDIVWVDSGELFGAQSVRLLSRIGLRTILYNHDDPTGKRDGKRFDSLLSSLPYYDLCVVVRSENIFEFKQRGAKNVLQVWRSYDEVVHAPFPIVTDIPSKLRSEVAFIGTWMRGEGRDKFILDLMTYGIPISLWGHRWNKSPLWDQLKVCYRGTGLSGRDYVAAIQGAKVCLGMLSKGNRDLHTTRTMEITYAGGVLCAERTSEHLQLYKEGIEAVFWRDAFECAEQCQRLLASDTWRESVRQAGMSRVRALRLGHENICSSIINFVYKI